jgi:hypothetical protein
MQRKIYKTVTALVATLTLLMPVGAICKTEPASDKSVEQLIVDLIKAVHEEWDPLSLSLAFDDPDKLSIRQDGSGPVFDYSYHMIEGRLLTLKSNHFRSIDPPLMMSLDMVDRVYERVGDVLQDHGYYLMYEDGNPEEERDAHRVERHAAFFAQGHLVDPIGISVFTAPLLVNRHNGAFDLYLPRKPDFQFAENEGQPNIEKAEARQIAHSVVSDPALLRRGRSLTSNFVFTYPDFSGPHDLSAGIGRYQQAARDRKLVLLHRTIIADEDNPSRRLMVFVDPIDGVPAAVRVIDHGGVLGGESEPKPFDPLGEWQIGEALGNLAAAELVTGDAELENVTLTTEDGRIVTFGWHEPEGLLVFDGKAYRPDDALAEAIRNRSITEPPAWLVEALKDKE